MFHGSTQKKYWLFPSIEHIDKLRAKCNEDFVKKYSVPSQDAIMVDEQKILCHYNEQKLINLCLKFQPPLPYAVIFTAFIYFKRIYLQTSIYENLPINMISVCLYMACKVEEYNISVDKFVLHYPEEHQETVTDVILGNEMSLMKLLRYHLIIHSPLRAMEGFILDIKTRLPNIQDVDLPRESAMEFLNSLIFTDAMFLYPPSQLALAALYTTSKEVVEKYMSVIAPNPKGKTLVEKLNQIIEIVKAEICYNPEQIKVIQEKLNRVKALGKGRKRKARIASETDLDLAKKSKASEMQGEDDEDSNMSIN